MKRGIEITIRSSFEGEGENPISLVINALEKVGELVVIESRETRNTLRDTESIFRFSWYPKKP